MSVDLQRIPALRQEADRLQGALEAETRQRTAQREQAAHQERLIAAQQEEMDLLAAKVGVWRTERRVSVVGYVMKMWDVWEGALVPEGKEHWYQRERWAGKSTGSCTGGISMCCALLELGGVQLC